MTSATTEQSIFSFYPLTLIDPPPPPPSSHAPPLSSRVSLCLLFLYFGGCLSMLFKYVMLRMYDACESKL